jgi:ribosomal protein S18 acetylase RimI-like enzyme
MIKEDGWLAAILGTPAFRADAGDVEALPAHMQGRTGFYFSKVDTADVATTKKLLSLGFFVTDVNVTFAVAPSALVRRATTIEVGPTPPGKGEDVMNVARDSFRFTRFHLDPLVTKEAADAVKKEWVRNYVDAKRGDHLFVAAKGGQPIGFLAALKTPTSAIIDLVGVHPTAQREGVGRALIQAFADHYANVDELVVGTQVANIPSVRLYESMGFRLKSSQYVLHLHLREGVAR